VAIRTVVTRGFGNGVFNGTIPLVTTRGYAIGAAAVVSFYTANVFMNLTPTYSLYANPLPSMGALTNVTPAINLDANITPAAEEDSNPSPGAEVESG